MTISIGAVPGSARGYRLIPSVIDELDLKDPKRVLYSIPKTNNLADGFDDISVHAFNRAVSRCSRFIEEELGRGTDFPTLTYMGPQDLMYAVLIIASIKTGYKLLLTSPRNTLEAQLSLFEKTSCHTFLLPAKFPLPIVKQCLAAREMQVIETPSLQNLLEDGDEPIYPYNKSFESAKYEPFVILHTSGSTGLPKPVTQTHATWTHMDAQCDLPALGCKPVFPSTLENKRAYNSFPLFHCAGIAILLPSTVFCNSTSVLGPWPPSADVANGMIMHANIQEVCMVPTVLIELAKDPTHLENLSRLDRITFGGGPLPYAVGNLINSKTRLWSVLGTTEVGVMPVQECDREDWQYMQFGPSSGSEFRHVSGKLYEHVIVKNESLARFQGVFGTFNDIAEWPMKDLYAKHPTKDNVWLYSGRTDDIVVFATGEKINPLGMEDIIVACPEVSAAIIEGVGRFQSSLLVEATSPPVDENEKASLLEKIWPTVEAANKEAPQHGKIHRNMILFTSPEKPVLRAGKGSVQRKLTLDLYQTEFDQLHAASESSTTTNGVNGSGTSGNIADAIKSFITESTSIDAKATDPDANLFELGLDSLQTTVVARELNGLLQSRGSKESVAPRTVYANPTISRLTRHITALIEGKSTATDPASVMLQMESACRDLCSSLPVSVRPAEPKPKSNIILLTGSTGSLGSYILHSLCQDPQVMSVYCLNRGKDSSKRQQKSHTAKALSTSFERVQFLDADYAQPYFGLPLPTYKQLLTETTNIIHNAWQVDFNLAFDSFTSHLQTVRHLINFSAHSRFGAHLFFISSIGTVTNYASIMKSKTDVPEQIFNEWNISQNAGYGQSKLVAERLLDAASREAGVPATICRVGQIAGSTTRGGMWPKQEWLPSLIASSKHLGKLPASLGSVDSVDWVPVDKAGQTIVELSRVESAKSSDQQTGATTYHLVNPQRTSWSALAPEVKKYLEASSGAQIEMVPLSEWVAALEQSATSLEDVPKNPATKILDFYQSLVGEQAEPVRLATERSVTDSRTLAGLGHVTDAWMLNWLSQWAF